MKRINLLGLVVCLMLGFSMAFAGHDEAAGVPAEKALGWLKNGNVRYTKNKLRKDGKSQVDRTRLASGQKPHTVVISCADSRVPPEIVFDQALGEIFVVRAAGQALDSSVIASAEYAVEHLGPKLLVVMGHSSCGAVKAAIETPKGKSAGSPDLDKLVADIKPRLGEVSTPSKGVVKESNFNAKGVAEDLVKRSAIIKKAVEEKGLVIKSSLYSLETGEVEFF